MSAVSALRLHRSLLSQKLCRRDIPLSAIADNDDDQLSGACVRGSAHLDIRRQIGEILARREFGESWAVAVIPDIKISHVPDLHAQRCLRTPQFEPVTATHDEHICIVILYD